MRQTTSPARSEEDDEEPWYLGSCWLGYTPRVEETEEPVCEFCGEPAMQCDCRGFITAIDLAARPARRSPRRITRKSPHYEVSECNPKCVRTRLCLGDAWPGGQPGRYRRRLRLRRLQRPDSTASVGYTVSAPYYFPPGGGLAASTTEAAVRAGSPSPARLPTSAPA